MTNEPQIRIRIPLKQAITISQLLLKSDDSSLLNVGIRLKYAAILAEGKLYVESLKAESESKLDSP